MARSFKESYHDVKNKAFIVLGPIVMRDTEEDFEQGIPTDTDRYGHAQKYNPAKIDVFGLPILGMAKAYEDGLTFSLYERSDLPRLLETMEEFLKVTDSAMRSINFRKAADDDVELIYNFGKNVVSLNERIKRGENVEIKKVLSIGGFVTPSMGDSTQTTKVDAPISARARGRIKRFKPRA